MKQIFKSKKFLLGTSFVVLAFLIAAKNTQVATGQQSLGMSPTDTKVFGSELSVANVGQSFQNATSSLSNSPKVVYQVIERAVPGPQGPMGPQGPAGKDGTTYNNTISSFFPNTAIGAQYFGYGNSSANPTGTGNLSSLTVSGLSSLSTLSGVGLSSCNSTTSKLMYNSTSQVFECGTDQSGSGGYSGGDLLAQGIYATTTIQSPVLYASTTNASTTNSININATSATFTSLFVSVASLTFATTTKFFSNSASVTSATFTNATSSNFFASVLNSLASTITDLLFTNATGTNATTTNLYTTNISSLGNFNLATGTISSSTITNLNSTNFFASKIIGTNATLTNATISVLNVGAFSPSSLEAQLATFTSGTATNWFANTASASNLFASNATFSYATVTNGFFTNLSVTGPVSAALNNGYVFRGAANNFSEATSTLFIANNMKVGIGSTTPSEKLSVQGNLLVSGNIVAPKISDMPDSGGSDIIICVDASGNITKDMSGNCYGTASSDERLKKNIVTVTNTLDKVKSLKTVNFNWIDEKRGTSTQLGYIAQDVEKVFPEAVKQDSNGYLRVNYLSLSAIYTNAIKELDEKVFQKIDEIISRIMGNERKILDLENRVKVLEDRLNVQPPTQTVGEMQPKPENTTETANYPVEKSNQESTPQINQETLSPEIAPATPETQ